MTDYELIVKCKEGSKKAHTELFFKYAPLLKKKFKAFRMRCPHSVLEFEDFQSEAYLWFMKAVNYVELDRLTAPSTWRFLTPYIWFVNNMIEDLVKSQRPHDSDVYLSTPIETGENATELMDFVSREGEFDSTSEKTAFQTMVAEEFYRSLSPSERALLDALNKSSHIKKTLIIKSAASELGCSKQWIYTQLAKIRTRFQETISCYA